MPAHGLGKGDPTGEVIWFKLDLSDPKVARKAAEDFMQMEQRLDVLGEPSVPAWVRVERDD